MFLGLSKLKSEFFRQPIEILEAEGSDRQLSHSIQPLNSE